MLLMEKLNYLFQHIEVVLCEEYRKNLSIYDVIHCWKVVLYTAFHQ